MISQKQPRRLAREKATPELHGGPGAGGNGPAAYGKTRPGRRFLMFEVY